ncbi:hypothetical protein VE02_08335 [Pseudogymnoascus sp. 03VT05]|nr:hypothetical protein VE02_08335 [Pseudogymnoascus sp. 03VT05]
MFVTCDFNRLNVNVILGYLWLAAVDPLLGFCAGVWWHAKVALGINVANAKEFYRETEEYQDYADVFNASATGILPEHHLMEHWIKLKPSAKPP